MKFLDLHREGINWESALSPVFADQSFINGPSVKKFESEIATYIGCKYAIGVSSGTDALLVSLMSLGVNSSSVVLTTPYTFIATTEVAFRLGATVKFCDVDSSFNIDINQCKEFIEKNKVDVFIPVHLFGLPCNLDEEILEICKNKGVKIVEDAAQAMGSKLEGKHVGVFGDLGCFSFFPAKNLGCAGDGGLITTNSKELYETCIAIRNHGGRDKYDVQMHGGNFRLDSIQAALLSAKLSRLDAWIRTRRNNAAWYNAALRDIVVAPDEPKNYISLHSYNQYVIQTEKRDALQSFLKNSDIPTAIYYPKPLNEQSCYSGTDFGCPGTKAKELSKINLALPIGHLFISEVEIITKKIQEFFDKNP